MQSDCVRKLNSLIGFEEISLYGLEVSGNIGVQYIKLMKDFKNCLGGSCLLLNLGNNHAKQ